MYARQFALVMGILFLIAGIAGFIPGLTAPGDAHGVHATGAGHGYLLGLFHVNWLHNLVHIVFGIWGVMVFRSESSSVIYARSVAISYALLVAVGLCPDEKVNTLGGLCPVHGHDVWLHATIALAAAVFGWMTFGRRTHNDPTDHPHTPHPVM